MKEHEFKIKLKRRDMNQIIASLGALPTEEDKKLVSKLRRVLKGRETTELRIIQQQERWVENLRKEPGASYYHNFNLADEEKKLQDLKDLYL